MASTNFSAEHSLPSRRAMQSNQHPVKELGEDSEWLARPPSSGPLCLYAFDITRLYIAARHFEIVMGLEVHPELRAVTKVQAEPERSVCRNASTIVDDLGNAVWRDANRFLWN